MASKSKLQKFAELVENPIVFDKKPVLKGKWKSDFFKNNHPIVLELACGKGDYTIALARQDKDKNFIGVDIKGPRIHLGAKTALEDLDQY